MLDINDVQSALVWDHESVPINTEDRRSRTFVAHNTNTKQIYQHSTQDRQHMCNITFRYVHVTTVAVGKQYVLYTLRMCVSSFSYPACKTGVLYYHLQPARLCNIFSHYLIHGTIFGEGGGGAHY